MIHSVEVMSDHVRTRKLSFSVFPVIVLCLSFGVALCVPVDFFFWKWEKNYQSKRLNILVIIREITEGKDPQKYN